VKITEEEAKLIEGKGSDEEWRIEGWRKFAKEELLQEKLKTMTNLNRYRVSWNLEMIEPEKLMEKFMNNCIMIGKCLIIDQKMYINVVKDYWEIIKFIGRKLTTDMQLEEEDWNKEEYEDDEENEWRYAGFGNNEYQADLFFIRNRERLGILLNLQKKQDKERQLLRIQIAKEAASFISFDVSTWKNYELHPDCTPLAYLCKNKWHKYKYMLEEYDTGRKVIKHKKMMKWKTRLGLKKVDVMWNDRHNLEFYKLFNNYALKSIYEREWELELGAERLWIKRESYLYEKWWEDEKEKELNKKRECLKILETKICIYERIKRMNSSIIEMKEEEKVMNSY
jgi:hypothetical protein